MWIPKDERLLLTGYYHSIGAVGTERLYDTNDFAKFLHCQAASEGWAEKKGDRITQIEQASDVSVRSQKANKILNVRGLINCTSHQTGASVNISLTVDGYDLGRRYTNWFIKSGLWFNEYRNHWIWLILAFFGGAFCTKLFDWLWLLLTRST